VENVTILGGKTGYTSESGHCLASFAIKDGKEYIAITTNGSGKYKPIYDSFEIYRNYLK
jgi:D-alanyl-D-alanine carboxypeptidase (penicillin-binding protein 5/6)